MLLVVFDSCKGCLRVGEFMIEVFVSGNLLLGMQGEVRETTGEKGNRFLFLNSLFKMTRLKR